MRTLTDYLRGQKQHIIVLIPKHLNYFQQYNINMLRFHIEDINIVRLLGFFHVLSVNSKTLCSRKFTEFYRVCLRLQFAVCILYSQNGVLNKICCLSSFRGNSVKTLTKIATLVTVGDLTFLIIKRYGLDGLIKFVFL